jgi:hypothetical protein
MNLAYLIRACGRQPSVFVGAFRRVVLATAAVIILVASGFAQNAIVGTIQGRAFLSEARLRSLDPGGTGESPAIVSFAQTCAMIDISPWSSSIPQLPLAKVHAESMFVDSSPRLVCSSPSSVLIAMKKILLVLLGSAALLARAADKIVVTVTHDLDLARPAEVIAVPFSEIQRLLPDMLFDHLLVKDATGAVVPSQGTNFLPEEHHDYYQDLVFQHDFAAGEKSATFTIEKTTTTVLPYPAVVFARYIPERFDDFAWENDRVGHRIYGPGLDSPAAGGSRMISSGIDVWCKRGRYPIVDRWYVKGHYHTDTGEGLDMYDVGTNRGCGGLGVWDGQKLFVSQNWKTWKVLANGPIRAVFEVTYEPWDAGNSVKVSETKRFTVDAGHNLDAIDSTFAFTPAPGLGGELTIAIGLTRHPKQAVATSAQDEKSAWISLWEDFKVPMSGNLGTGVILGSAARFAGLAETGSDRLILAKVKPGETFRYYAGAGWKQSGDFSSIDDWNAYLAAWAKRLASPIKIANLEAR